MHLLAPRPPEEQLPMFFNVTTAVGQNAPNASAEDILLASS
jgi:hypothetical protein